MIKEIVTVVNHISYFVVEFLYKEIIYSSVIFFILLPFLIIFRKRSLYFVYGLYVLILIRLLLPVNLSTSMNVSVIFQKVINQIKRNSYYNTHILSMPLSHSDAVVYQPENNSEKNRFDSIILLFAFWIIGICFLLNRYARRTVKFNRLVKRSHPVQNECFDQYIRKWRNNFKIHKPIYLVTSSEYRSPFTAGIKKPFIYLPDKFIMKQDLKTIEMILAHELAHIKRYDDLWIKLQSFIQCLYFFHPICWFVNRNLFLIRESICDQMVLAFGGFTREEYSHGLLCALKLNNFDLKHSYWIPGYINHKNLIIKRIQNLRGGCNMQRKSKYLVYFIICVIGFFLLPMCEETGPNPEDMETSKLNLSAKSTNPEQRFVSPVKGGKIKSGYGMRRHPISGKMVMHQGVDIPELTGTPILACGDGIVQTVMKEYEKGKGCGKYIVLQHADGYQSKYTQLDSILVYQEQKVRSGETIGLMGATGMATGPHLHFELIEDGKHINPEDMIIF